MNGEEPENDAWVMDWTRRAGTCGIWLRRREQYQVGDDRLILTPSGTGVSFEQPNLPFLIEETE